MEIPFSEIIEIDYKKGFFDNNAPMKNRYQFKNICYDTLYLKLKTKEITIHINTEFGGFNKLLDVLRKKKNIIIHDYQ